MGSPSGLPVFQKEKKHFHTGAKIGWKWNSDKKFPLD